MARTEKGFQPLLAERKAPDLYKLDYPMLGSPKLDGIRCIIRDGKALSRKLKPIPNTYIQQCLHGLPEGLDGELIVGGEVDSRVWNGTQSGVMSRDGEPQFTYHIFDFVCDLPFAARYTKAAKIVDEYHPAYPWLRIVPHMAVDAPDEVLALEERYVAEGYEGLMLRSWKGPYKFGRATLKEQTLLKVKRFIDAEAVVVGVVERMHNANEQERDERGYAKRSHAKDGKVGTDTLGALVCQSCVREDGTLSIVSDDPKEIIVEFEIGTGFNDEQRTALWARRDTDLIGTVHTFKYQGLTPDDKKPRFPVWKGERSILDISEAAE
jgi:DNA ligase-1